MGIEEKEFYKIFDIYIAVKPYFKSLKVEDDGGFGIFIILCISRVRLREEQH